MSIRWIKCWHFRLIFFIIICFLYSCNIYINIPTEVSNFINDKGNIIDLFKDNDFNFIFLYKNSKDQIIGDYCILVTNQSYKVITYKMINYTFNANYALFSNYLIFQSVLYSSNAQYKNIFLIFDKERKSFIEPIFDINLRMMDAFCIIDDVLYYRFESTLIDGLGKFKSFFYKVYLKKNYEKKQISIPLNINGLLLLYNNKIYLSGLDTLSAENILYDIISSKIIVRNSINNNLFNTIQNSVLYEQIHRLSNKKQLDLKIIDKI